MAPHAPLAPIDRFADECPTDNPFFVTTRFNRPETRTGGPGAIYPVDLRTDEVRLWNTVPGVGADPHDRPEPWPAHNARDAVGFRGLGDLDITPDGRSLHCGRVTCNPC